jgi:ribonucleoside-diphosphate reductase beta chain
MSFTLFPIKSSEKHLFDMYKQSVAVFWTPEEISFAKDGEDWAKLNDDERHFIKRILAFFAGSDGIVQENLATRFQREVDSQVVKLFYSFQNAMEGIHAETYSLLIDTYVKDEQEKAHLFQAIDTIPCIGKKAQWALKWIDSQDNFAKRLVAFAAVEGIFFSGAFCSIYWLKKRGLMPGLTFSNELISKDEGLHCEFATLLYSKIQNRIPQEQLYQMMEDAVNIEKEFVSDSIPVHLLGMNATSMCTYIEFVANRLMTQLGYEKLYKDRESGKYVENPFEWMELISLRPKSNFFEVRVGEYVKATKSDQFEISEDF